MNNAVYALALDAADSVIYAGGTFTTVNGATTRNRIARGDHERDRGSWDANMSNTVRTLAHDATNGLSTTRAATSPQ